MSAAEERRNVCAVAWLACLVFVVSAPAQEAAVRAGAFEAVFTERWPESSLREVFKRMQHVPQMQPPADIDYRIEGETYSVYVPSDYASNTPHGLLVWVNAGERGNLPKGWDALMDKHRLIWIGAHRSGNRHSVPARRMPLALDAAFNMTKKYNIDPNRVYVSGISGGGRVASILAMHYSEVFSGGIFVVGVEYWEPLPVTGRPGQFWPPMPRPQATYLAIARKRGRYVLLTGDHDGNRLQTKNYYEQGYKKQLKHVLYIQVPDMGHQMPSMEWYEKAIVFLDTAMGAVEGLQDD